MITQSSSSDDEPAPRAIPAKKRAKVAPVTADDGSDESEFEDEFDDDLYKVRDPEDTFPCSASLHLVLGSVDVKYDNIS